MARRVVFAIVAVAACAALAIVLFHESPESSPSADQKIASSSPEKISGPVTKGKSIVSRSETDIPAMRTSASVATSGRNPATAQAQIPADSPATPDGEAKYPPANPGKVQPVRGNLNADAASVLEALKSGDKPERLSILIEPAPFDREAFEKDPEKYLHTVEPGRVFQSAEPDENTPALKAEGVTIRRIKPGESVKLAITGAPRAPVTFTATDLGSFAENNLNSVTVRADAEGRAFVTFVATPGVTNDAHVLAGSPLASGQAHFTIEIQGNAAAAAAPGNTPQGKSVPQRIRNGDETSTTIPSGPEK
ncbi:MAG: hypothetical protein V1809_11125 [Planctomycetota bacterium]